MNLESLFQKNNQGAIIEELKSKRPTPQPDIEKAKKELDPARHDVFDPILRPDKRVKIDPEDINSENVTSVITANGQDIKPGFRPEKVARIAVALQKLIVKRAVAFLFGNPVELNSQPENKNQELVLKALKRVLFDVKSKSLNRKIARQLFSCTEVAELWYPTENENQNYGFRSKYKLRCAIFSPLLGDTLYPYFNETGDMIAFSRAFTRSNTQKVKEEYFETYTDEKHYLWKNGTGGYAIEKGYPKAITIGKIPIVYAQQPGVEWEDVQVLIDRLEKLLSNFADTNDYHAAPKIFTTGEILGFSKKGESGAVIEGEEGSTAQYLAWQNAPESVKLEIETLLRLIHTITQTPDISFDSVKGLGAISGIALKLLFLDAHLKVTEKQEIFDDYLQRRISIIKSYLGKFNTKLAADCDALMVEPEIIPYIIKDDKAEIELLVTANGGKPVVSQKQSAKLAGLTNNSEEDFEQILEESKRENAFSIGEPIDA